MATHTPTTPARAGRRTAAVSAIAPPPMPPKTPEELATHESLMRQMRECSALLHQRNLDTAVALAQMAARGHGPLVEHFQELGRRYSHLLNKPAKPGLRVIAGGAA
jgi:hypothetical protein